MNKCELDNQQIRTELRVAKKTSEIGRKIGRL
jgi:hypothetical protein